MHIKASSRPNSLAITCREYSLSPIAIIAKGTHTKAEIDPSILRLLLIGTPSHSFAFVLTTSMTCKLEGQVAMLLMACLLAWSRGSHAD
jgi:Na+/H+-dicarboxylate symporter